MLNAFRRAPLRLTPGDASGGDFAYIEAWQNIDATGTRTRDLKAKTLENYEVQDWVWRQGPFARVSSHKNGSKFEGGLRILFAQSALKHRQAVPGALISSQVLEALQLPASTFASFQQPSGVFSCHTIPEGTSIDECKRLGLVFRTPQKRECTIGGFALAHDFETGITTALSLGNHFQLHEYKSKQGTPSPPPAMEEFLAQLRDSENLWSHTLLLPCLFLVVHVQRVRTYIMEDLSRQIVLVENRVGITQTSRSQKHCYAEQGFGNSLFVGEQLQREQAKALTREINNLSTWIIFTKRSPQWDIDCIKFLLQLLNGNQRFLAYRDIPAQTFRETLDYVQNYSEAGLEVTQSSEARMHLQLNILYTSVAQDDGQTSARLAASAGKDSTSMKIIALITAAYLPATFVAKTMFSMGMFEWQSQNPNDDNDNPSKSSVSPDFWIYWAVAVPLTVITLAGWATWWKFEQHRFDLNVQQAIRDKPPSLDLSEVEGKDGPRFPWDSREFWPEPFEIPNCSLNS
ncbi:hypothetical protein SCAR479_05290 [Seiridium cardinale]|uniref:Uncharacterized protein n=1 Tax=Seiridium cardinale TaxID=138064 RepID=A0ABR2XVX2_9PEZI